jgi:hypothetical protein
MTTSDEIRTGFGNAFGRPGMDRGHFHRMPFCVQLYAQDHTPV